MEIPYDDAEKCVVSELNEMTKNFAISIFVVLGNGMATDDLESE